MANTYFFGFVAIVAIAGLLFTFIKDRRNAQNEASIHAEWEGSAFLQSNVCTKKLSDKIVIGFWWRFYPIVCYE